MNVVLPTKKEINTIRIIVYISIIILCIIAVSMAVYVQYYKNQNVNNDKEFGKKEQINSKQLTKEQFSNMFNNTLLNSNTQIELQKEFENYEFVFTRYKNQNNIEGKYTLDINIPHININEENIKEYNQKIARTFLEKAKNIVKDENSINVIYIVEYTANIKDNILSLVIRANLKEGNNAQRLIIQTYNYDLEKKQELTIDKILETKGIDKEKANEAIKEEIKKVEAQVEEFEKLGYTIYKRNPESDIYNVENISKFYIDNDDNLYLIFAYGNKEFTSEMDLVVF